MTMRRAVAPAPEPTRPAAAPSPATSRWTTDYAAAVSKAKESKRNVCVFFTGSDWCGWCVKLKSEVLAKPEFERYASENLVLVELDFPKGKPQSAEVKAQNNQLAQQYRVRGFPTVIVLNSAGKQIAQLGYQEGGPGPVIAALKKL